MSEEKSQNLIVADRKSDEEQEGREAKADPILSPRPTESGGFQITSSDSMFFPTASDPIWESPTLIAGLRLVLREFESDSSDEEPISSYTAAQENGAENERAEEENGTEKYMTEEESALSLSDDEVITHLPAPFRGEGSDSVVSSGTEKETTTESCGGSYPASIAAVPDVVPREHTALLLALRERAARLSPTGPDASLQEVERKLIAGLRLLNDLAHVNSQHDVDLRRIHDAYFFFARALFRGIEPSGDVDGSSVDSERSREAIDSLEERKKQISEQEALLEKEILHFKATKRELEEVTRRLEEVSRAYRPSDALKDVVIPQDVKLSSSSEYVEEIGELQRDILAKQEQLGELHRELQEKYLPKPLVDSICESHRLAAINLKETEEEIGYLKECVTRLDLKYLYSTQIS